MQRGSKSCEISGLVEGVLNGLSGRKATKDSGKGLCVAGGLAEVAAASIGRKVKFNSTAWK